VACLYIIQTRAALSRRAMGGGWCGVDGGGQILLVVQYRLTRMVTCTLAIGT